jgi:tRNA 2-thiouridine synthesizing protein B
MLHTVNKSPFERESLDTCLRLARQGSDVLLIEDAVYAALAGARFEPVMREAMACHSIFVLKEDIDARGIDPGALIAGIEIVDYGGFVDLAVKNDAVQSWL